MFAVAGLPRASIHKELPALAKGCDVVIGNLVGPDKGFGEGRTQVLAVSAGEPAVPYGPATKAEVAQFVLDQAIRVREQRRGA